MYFNHNYTSNSDLKALAYKVAGKEKPENIQDIYDLGTELHYNITEPHKMTLLPGTEKYELAMEMRKTFFKDDLCRNFIMSHDFRREHEFYRVLRNGVNARCKTDGDSKGLKTIFEFKGLSVTTQKGFEDAIVNFDYDQGAAWYLDVCSGFVQYKQVLMVGISKKQPDRLFKLLVDRNHLYYKTGSEKIRERVQLWKSFGLN
jgi:hypothetical protein